MKEFLVFLCHAFVLESYQDSIWQENNGQSFLSLRAVVDAVRQPKLGMSFCWAQGSD